MALKTGVELLEGLVYKLQMMGVPIEGYCHTCVDNMSVVNNTSVPESVLKKKSNSIAYNMFFTFNDVLYYFLHGLL